MPRFGVDVVREDDYTAGLPPSLRPGHYGASQPRPVHALPDVPPRSPVSSLGSRPSTSGGTNSVPTFTSSGQEDTVRPGDGDRLLRELGAFASQRTTSTPDETSTVVPSGGYDDVGTNETDIIWARKPREPEPSSKSPRALPGLTIETPSPGSATITRADPTIFPPPPDYRPRPRPQRPRTPKNSHKSTTFEDSTWAPRPPPEDVYDRLQDFFPEHDLDKPVIEANSGGTSPTAVEPVYGAPSAFDKDRILMKGKKSIRYVAEEHKKRIDRTSRASASSYSNVLRKRSTKLWGSRVEEVLTSQSRPSLSRASPDSPSGGPRPIFKWVRGELIGKGTYGRVYLALNATTGEMIAVKQVEIPTTASDKSDHRQANFVQALKMESETLKDLDHPHIVQYLGFEETPSFLSIFLEYVPGGSIGSCLRDHGRFDEEVTKSFTSQILDGLDYLHSKNIIHRDLKSDNILVEKTGICKISDFGISKRTDDTNAPAFTAMQGTVFWMAPEVINAQKGKGYNSKIDIWSVGCVVLEMWAGKRPWSDEDFFTVMYKVIHQQQSPPIPSEVILSDLATDFKNRCFATNPDERASAAELQQHPYLELPEGWMFMDFK
ncbi:Pkinase-domain-containing protein [Leucogyrophana mollusca]|uniref:Pkinase-domain-containing protein n=1 Tax=Leucogyrophana mollusca TaxID=85980 RepID=A0ACB8BUM1_9AGAM|nr:Pkinase-domain-containing protein [Leucogyrophana mollusca]